jgi:predicted kinase
MLIILGGLPGVGKTTIAAELARRMGAVHLRIDSIEQAMLESGALSGPMNDAGYRVAYAVAADNLRIGRKVVADSVNPLRITREAWRAVARETGAPAVEVEIICSDAGEHRARVETRACDIAGFKLPTWDDVTRRDYEAWEGAHLVIDTAGRTVEENVEAIRKVVTASA